MTTPAVPGRPAPGHEVGDEHSAGSAAPVAAVWAVWSDIARWPEWNPGIRSVVADGPMAPGTAFTMITPPDDTPIAMTISAVEAGRSFTDRFDGGDLIVTTVHRVEPVGAGSRVTYRTEITGPGSDENGAEFGSAITADLPEVVSALLDRAASVRV